MSLMTFNPPIEPDVGSSGSHEYRVREAQFGDGYEQVTGDGINVKRSEYRLTWNAISRSDADSIESFLDDRGGHEAFNYTLPNDSTPLKFRCKSFDRTWASGDTVNITAQIRRVYDL